MGQNGRAGALSMLHDVVDRTFAAGTLSGFVYLYGQCKECKDDLALGGWGGCVRYLRQLHTGHRDGVKLPGAGYERGIGVLTELERT
jgi:hypothetical protein